MRRQVAESNLLGIGSHGCEDRLQAIKKKLLPQQIWHLELSLNPPENTVPPLHALSPPRPSSLPPCSLTNRPPAQSPTPKITVRA
jgi:hypothetical protein